MGWRKTGLPACREACLCPSRWFVVEMQPLGGALLMVFASRCPLDCDMMHVGPPWMMTVVAPVELIKGGRPDAGLSGGGGVGSK